MAEGWAVRDRDGNIDVLTTCLRKEDALIIKNGCVCQGRGEVVPVLITEKKEWTSEPPTVEGMYRWRETMEDKPRWFNVEGGFDMGSVVKEILSRRGGLWLGPIEPPE